MRPAVLIFAGSDPSTGAGLQADTLAIAAHGAHPLTVVTAVTVQDNDRVFSVNPVSPELVAQQARVLIDKIDIAAVKIGIPGSAANAQIIAELIADLRNRGPDLPVVLDTVLASGHGNALSVDDAIRAVHRLLPLASIATPNLPEAAALTLGERNLDAQAGYLLQRCPHVLIKGGHGEGPEVINTWFSRSAQRSWRFARLDGEFHGSGCTLASALAARLALGGAMEESIETALVYAQQTLDSAYEIAHGQRIPERYFKLKETK